MRSPLRTTLFASNRPFIRLKQPTQTALKLIVWDTPRWFLFSVPKLEWVKLLAVPLVLAAAGSIITSQFQREENQNKVLKEYFDQLDTLTFEQGLLSAEPDAGALVMAKGRTVAALRELDLPRRQQLISFLVASGLSRHDLENPGAVISFSQQNLSDIDLHGLDLSRLEFQDVNLTSANLEGAVLGDANLEGAYLWSANLQGAVLWSANLEGADLGFANLEGAVLSRANLEGANLWSANLEGADLGGANLEGAYLWGANLEGVENLTQSQLSEALLCRTTLPDDIALDPNRDCEELGIDPETGEYVGP